jgi:hypothetical protein
MTFLCEVDRYFSTATILPDDGARPHKASLILQGGQRAGRVLVLHLIPGRAERRVVYLATAANDAASFEVDASGGHGLPAHKTTLVKTYVASTKGMLMLHFFPGYAPELSPDVSSISQLHRAKHAARIRHGCLPRLSFEREVDLRYWVCVLQGAGCEPVPNIDASRADRDNHSAWGTPCHASILASASRRSPSCISLISPPSCREETRRLC